MSWRNRLAERRDISKRAGGLTDKTDKRAFVSSVSDPEGHPENIAASPATRLYLRAHLLVLAAAAQVDPHHVHRMLDPEVADYAGRSDEQMTACLHMMADTADRNVGRVPAGDTAAMHCIHCGPVYIHPDIAAVLPVVDGLPRGLGCPWCFVRKAGGSVPRPALSTGDNRPAGPVLSTGGNRP